MSNRHGTYKRLENAWARKLKKGYGIEVKVTDVTRRGETRPFKRVVEWTEVTPKGGRRSRKLDFGNFSTPEGRAAQGVPPTRTDGRPGVLLQLRPEGGTSP